MTEELAVPGDLARLASGDPCEYRPEGELRWRPGTVVVNHGEFPWKVREPSGLIRFVKPENIRPRKLRRES